jgi:hypothetical protein
MAHLKEARYFTKGLPLLATLGIAASLACKSSTSASSSRPSSPAPRSSTPVSSGSARADRAASNDTRRRFSDCTRLLMESLTAPAAPYRFAYKAQENINPKFPSDKTAKPEVGPVEVVADSTGDEISITTVRGKKKTEHKAAKTDQLAWSMATLELIGPVVGTGVLLAFGQPVAQMAGSDTVGGVAVDKYDFDTSTATGSTKAGLEIAKSMLTSLQSTKGTIWLEKSTGKLVKFNIDADFADRNTTSWKEHHEGEVVPR